MLELRKLNKHYDNGRQILTDLDYRLEAGEFVAIMGDSGVGKSTLLNLIAGLDTADSGAILIDGVDIASLDDNAATQLRRSHFGFVFQAFHVLPHLTLLQNIALPLLLNGGAVGRGNGGNDSSPGNGRNGGDTNSNSRVGMPYARAQEMLEAVGLAGRGQDFPRQLSGGELQRVAIARALVHRPRLVLADEPTGNLDPETAHEILLLLRSELKASGASALMVTHSQAAAASADRIVILSADGLHPAPA